MEGIKKPQGWSSFLPCGHFYIFTYSRPSSQSTETPKMSASAASSLSETGRFCPSNNDSAGILISIPATCSFASNSTCFMPILFLASVTRAPIMLRSPSSSFLVFRQSPSYLPKVYVSSGLPNLVIPNIMK